jgi:hypothetical protein
MNQHLPINLNGRDSPVPKGFQQSLKGGCRGLLTRLVRIQARESRPRRFEVPPDHKLHERNQMQGDR